MAFPLPNDGIRSPAPVEALHPDQVTSSDVTDSYSSCTLAVMLSQAGVYARSFEILRSSFLSTRPVTLTLNYQGAQQAVNLPNQYMQSLSPPVTEFSLIKILFDASHNHARHVSSIVDVLGDSFRAREEASQGGSARRQMQP